MKLTSNTPCQRQTLITYITSQEQHIMRECTKTVIDNRTNKNNKFLKLKKVIWDLNKNNNWDKK